MVRAPLVFLVGVVSLCAIACGHNIGDSCKTSVDCSQGGERLCDVTQPDGYCTIFNCEPNHCPSEAACVVFDPQLSSANACTNTNGLSRFARSFCLFRCGSNDDCRDGYECRDFSSGHLPNDWNALAVDTDRGGKVCVATHVGVEPAPDRLYSVPNNVCSAAQSSGGSSSGGSSSGGASSSGGSSSGAASGAGGADAGAGGGGP
ncbi:MAG: hypothetical protein QM756_00905 [Polyangiaceae bacterium]